MRIRTQNKTMLLEVDNFIINDKAEIIGYSIHDSSNTFLLGSYNTIDECIDVLNAIRHHYKYFEMPESASMCKSIVELDVPYNIISDLYELNVDYIYEINPRIMCCFSRKKRAMLEASIERLKNKEISKNEINS